MSVRTYNKFVFVPFIALLALGCSKGIQIAEDISSEELASQTPGVFTVQSPKAAQTLKKNIEVSGTCGVDGSISFSGDIVTRAPVACADGVYKAAIELSGMDGIKAIHVRQTTGALVQDISLSVTNDNTAPQLSLITPAQNAAVKTDVIVQGLCEKDLGVAITVGANTFTLPCPTGSFATTLPLAVADGALMVKLAQTDVAGNEASLNLALSKDTVAPTVSISAPASGAAVQSTATIQGACETGFNVEISGTGVSAPANISCVAGAFSGSVAFTAGSGTKNISVSQTDLAGNKSSVARAFSFTATGPAVEITAPVANSYFQNTLAVSGTCQTGLAVVLSGAGWQSPAMTTCTNGTFSVTVTFTAGDGTKNLIVTQTNATGDSGSNSRSFIRDQTAPALTISSPAANTSTKQTIQLMGACETGLPVAISGSGVAASSVTCAFGAYSASLNLLTGDGNKEVRVTQTDTATNATTLTRNFVRDTTAPAVLFASPAENTSAETSLTITGSCENGLPVVVSGPGVTTSVSATCSNAAFSQAITFSTGDGTKSVQISQTDLAGNVGTALRNFVRAAPMPVLDGALLYAQNCALCHGQLASSNKRNSSASDISSGIKDVAAMKSLSTLSSAQISAIATALSNKTASFGEVSDPQIPLGNRTFLASVYNDLFVATTNPNSDDTKIKNLTSSLLLTQVVAHGGPCLAYDSNCNSSQSDTAPFALGSPTGNAMRKGYTTRACDQILEIDRAVVNVLGKTGFTTATTITTASVQSVFSLFNPGKTAPAEVLNALINTGTAAKTAGYSVTDQWRFTILPLCLSSTMDIL